MLDSAHWPADAANACAVHLQVPTSVTPPPLPKPPLSPPPPGTYQARAELVSHELQNLAESIDDLITGAVGHDLHFTLQIDTDGSLPPEVLQRLNTVLKEVSPSLVLKTLGT